MPGVGTGGLLRIGLLLDGPEAPPWVNELASAIGGCECAEIHALVFDATANGHDFGPQRGPMLNLYYRLDHLLFGGAPGPNQDVRSVAERARALTVTPIRHGGGFRIESADLARIAALDLDVVLVFGFGIPLPGLETIARSGIWWSNDHEDVIRSGTPSGFWEVADHHVFTQPSLHGRLPDRDEPVVIDRLQYESVHHGLDRNRTVALGWTNKLILTKLRELYESPGRKVVPLSDGNGEERRDPPPASALNIPRFVSQNAARYLALELRERTVERAWSLAYRIGDAREPPTNLSGFTFVDTPSDAVWADPFPVLVRDRWFIFFEDVPAGEEQGRISVLEIDEHGQSSPPRVALELPYHTSYPFLFRHEGQLFMIPETADNETVEVYRCESLPDRWVFHATLIDGVNAVDTSLAEVDGTWWMFTTIAPLGFDPLDTLCLFSADTPFGPWRPHPANPVKRTNAGSRCAGSLFVRDAALYRPSQDCTRGYAL